MQSLYNPYTLYSVIPSKLEQVPKAHFDKAVDTRPGYSSNAIVLSF